MTEKEDNIIDALPGSNNVAKYVAWILPVVAIVLSAWLIYRAIPSASHSITLVTDSAINVKSNSTQIFHRGVAIGLITDVKLNEDLSEVQLTARLDEHMEAFAKQGASFWTVRPHLQGAQLSGLSTIVSGPEIHAEPGSGDKMLAFNLQEAPLPRASPDNLKISLLLPSRGSLGRGSKILFRGVEVGLITSIGLNERANGIQATAEVFADQQHLVRDNSVFWNSGGLSVDFGLFSGAHVKASSMQSLIAGSISFATPEKPGSQIKSGQTFEVTDSPKNDGLKWQPVLTDAAYE